MITQPLADKIRPKKLNQIIGQHHLLDTDKPIYQLIKNKTHTSMILYGVPGVGKTTLATVYASELQLPLETFNGATDNKSKLQTLIKNHDDETFVLLIDEIHRLTKPIQDHLLPYIEHGNILLIGTTTANPIINIDPAIRSRCILFEFKPINYEDIAKALKNAYHQLTNTKLPDDIAIHIAKYSNGDVRFSLNMLEVLNSMYDKNITIENIDSYAQNQNFVFDKNGDNHYDTISALQKSIRGADTDASLYYTGVMCLSGDLKTLIRRLIVIAYEDIGLADPQIVQQAVTALLASENLGLPEARIPISNAVILLCNARHSNSAYTALDSAIQDAKHHYPIPNHLKDTHYSGAQKLDHGTGYKYPHDYPHSWVKQQYLPNELIDVNYYKPKNKSENIIYKRYIGLKKLQQKD